MKKIKHLKWPLLAGLVVGLAAMLLTVSLVSATPTQQTDTPPTDVPLQAKACSSCHAELVQTWADSPHANAFSDPVFQERWHGLNQTGDCLLCHTTNFVASKNHYDAQGVSCEACHGKIPSNHPLQPALIRDDAQYCGACHTTTIEEWRLTAHAQANIGCTDCHEPHSQQSLFEDPDQMCINCHKDSMGPYLEDIHLQKGIGCVDCHQLVIPPDPIPVTGIVPTGHSFTITPETCVACHTDALHAGFSLPGFEHGAAVASATITETAQTTVLGSGGQTLTTPEERINSLESQLTTLEAAAANRSMTVLFQGGVVGLVLGGSTAWIVANNIRAGRKEEEEDGEEVTQE